MKRYILAILIVGFIQIAGFAQVNITLQFDVTQKIDSVSVQGYQSDTGFYKVLSKPYAKTLSIKEKKSLSPGLYFILCDSNMTAAFLISSAANQTFTVSIQDETFEYTGSVENQKYKEYLDQMNLFEMQMSALNQEFNDAKGRLPQYMLGPIVDTLNAKALRIKAATAKYQDEVIAENPGMLLASVIAASKEIPQPSKEISNNRMLLQEYYMQHYFDGFPWNDPRIFNTPIGDNKIKDFNSFIVQWRRKDLYPYVLSTLKAAKVNTESYYIFFDKLEKVIGDHASPYRVESVYIDMLKDMLTIPKLPELRKRHCMYEIGVIDKNHEGERANDFRIVTNTGDTTSLYEIQSEYLLLYLQHPTCPTCQRVRKLIADFPMLNKAIASGRLKVLTVYFEDELEIWNNYINSPEANPNYMHGWNFDQSIAEKNLYDTRAIPYMFILDKDKRILHKNVMENDLEDVIRQLHIIN